MALIVTFMVWPSLAPMWKFGEPPTVIVTSAVLVTTNSKPLALPAITITLLPS